MGGISECQGRFGAQGCVAVVAGWAVILGLGCGQARYHRGPVTENFDGLRFRNPEGPPQDKSYAQFLRWQLNRDRGPWERRGLPEGLKSPEERVGDGRLVVTFVNHATVLIQMDGLNILTDPLWSRRASPVSWAGPRRYVPPGVAWEDLPPIDVVLISHNHYDHFDTPTLRRLAKRDSPRIIVPLGDGTILRREGIPGGEELDWWQSVEIADGVSVTLTPKNHWSARGTRDRFASLWGGFVIDSADSGVVYYAGDTGYGGFYGAVRERFGAPRLALLPIGAYKPRWFMQENHQDPAEAVRAHQVLGAKRSLAVHWGTFRLGDDGQDEPAQEARWALQDAGLSEEEFWLLLNGESREVPLVE